MTKLVLLFAFISLYNFSYSQTKREFEMPEGDTVYVMKMYYMCLLYKGNTRDQDSATTAKIQEQHLAHTEKLAQKGIIQMAGPFGHNGDLRGIFIYDVDTKEEAENYANADPAIKAGRLRYEIYPWWCAKGTTLK